MFRFCCYLYHCCSYTFNSPNECLSFFLLAFTFEWFLSCTIKTIYFFILVDWYTFLLLLPPLAFSLLCVVPPLKDFLLPFCFHWMITMVVQYFIVPPSSVIFLFPKLLWMKQKDIRAWEVATMKKCFGSPVGCCAFLTLGIEYGEQDWLLQNSSFMIFHSVITSRVYCNDCHDIYGQVQTTYLNDSIFLSLFWLLLWFFNSF